MAVDAWANTPAPGWLDKLPEVNRLLEQSHSPALELMNTPEAYTPEALVAAMDAAGVGRALFCGWQRPRAGGDTTGESGVVVSNDTVARFTRAFPDRFAGIAAVDLEDPVGAVRELTRCVKELGFVALRVVQWLWERPPTDALYYPLYVRCVELGIPVCLQVGHTGPLKPSYTGRPVPYIDEIALRFPDLKIVCGHIGYPWTDEMIGVAWKHPNVYIDTSAYLPRYYPVQLMTYLSSRIGRKKVLFGTNWPQLTWSKCMEQVEDLGLDDGTREDFLWGNAERVFGLPPASARVRELRAGPKPANGGAGGGSGTSGPLSKL